MAYTFTTKRLLTPEELDKAFRKLDLNPQTHKARVQKELISLFPEGDEWERANQHNSGGHLTVYRYKVTEVSSSKRNAIKNAIYRFVTSPVRVTINPDELDQKPQQ